MAKKKVVVGAKASEASDENGKGEEVKTDAAIVAEPLVKIRTVKNGVVTMTASEYAKQK